MITLNATQQTILSATRQRVSWLFIVTTGDGLTTYHWSTKAKTFGGNAYTFAIIPQSFSGITMNRGRSELGIQGPTEMKFSVPNKGNTLSPADFVDGSVIVREVIGDYAGNEEIIRGWKFKIRTCSNIYQVMEFTCIDFLQDILAGQYPTLPLAKDIFLSKNTDQDTQVCPPLPFGQCYVPLRPVYTDSELFYLLGPGTGAYTVAEVRSPRSWGAKQTWPATDYTLTQATKADALARNWKVLSPKIAFSRAGLSVPDVTGFWRNGERYLDIPAKFSWDVTAALTSPEHVLEFILSNATYGMGLAAANLNAASFTAAGLTFVAWGLVWGGGLWKLEDREKILSRLLRMCHSVLDIGEDISLRPLSAVSQAAITAAAIVRDKKKSGRGPFTMTAASRRQLPDGQYVSWQEAGEAQDEFQKTLVPVVDGATPVRPSTDTFECPWVQDSQMVQKLGLLDAQRRFLPAGEVSFPTKPGIAGVYCTALQTDDIITINGSNYGGSYDVLIDSMTIKPSGICEFRCNILGAIMIDAGDITPPPVLTYPEPVADNPYVPATTGPIPAIPSEMQPNEAKGDLILKAGANIILAGGAIKNNSQSSGFELSEDTGIMGKGAGINIAALMTADYAGSPIQWFSEASFVEVSVTAPYAPPSKTTFYSDAFKEYVTGTLTVTAAVESGDTWSITFSGATLVENAQVGNLMLGTNYGVPWYKYLTIVANGTDWIEVRRYYNDFHCANLPFRTSMEVFELPAVGYEFALRGAYAVTILDTWQQPFALWFASGDNVGESAEISRTTVVDRTTGKVVLASAMTNNIVAGDRFKAWDSRMLLEYQWRAGQVLLSPSNRVPPPAAPPPEA